MSVPAGALTTASEAWKALVPLLAGRPHMLVSLDGGRSYRGRGRRRISEKPPCQPAAIPVYDDHGMTRLLALDLDAGRAGTDRVLADCALIEQLLERAGGRVVVDRSPSGGHHVYVPLGEPLALGEARSIMRALAARAPSLDITPMLNTITGVIRPPGSLYKRGQGHQELITPLAIAYDTLRRPNSAEVVRRLRRELAAELLAQQADTGDAVAHASLSDDLADVPWQPLPGGMRSLTSAYRQIAESGVYDAARYKSPSEARQAVLCSAVAAGMQLVDVARRLETGLWPGLASFYARYAARHWRRALLRDWTRADAYVRRQRAQRTGNTPARGCDTREQETHGGRALRPCASADAEPTAYQFVRMWIAGVDHEAPHRYTPAVHMLLRSLAEMAQKTGRTRIGAGCQIAIDHCWSGAPRWRRPPAG